MTLSILSGLFSFRFLALIDLPFRFFPQGPDLQPTPPGPVGAVCNRAGLEKENPKI